MEIIIHSLLALILCLAPAAFVFIRILRKREEQRALSKAPFNDLVRRPAGETLRLKLAEFDEQGIGEVLGLLMCPIILAVELIYRGFDLIGAVTFSLASLGCSIFFGMRLLKIIQLRANYQLGYDGERFVGEELSRLMALGYEIYHDVPFDGFNLDHVLVGPQGLFVVETKTRRKQLNANGKSEFRVGFDGKMLQWSWGSDNHGVDQAKNNAKTLAIWLSSATGAKVWATPILTLPGWLVDRKAPSKDIYVLNPKEIFGFCKSFAGGLSAQEITQICHQLDQKCRIPAGD